MSDPATILRSHHHIAVPNWVGPVIECATKSETAASYLAQAVAALRTMLPCDFAAVVRGEKGRWQTLASTGRDSSLPGDLLSESLDRGTTLDRTPWCISPLADHASTNELLVVSSSAAASREAVGNVAQVLGQGLLAVRRRDQLSHRIQRLETLLNLSGQWNQTLQLNELLTHIAEAATRLLNAERASIFLWDRPTRTLVGRPALGVEGNELRVPDDQGIVGVVLRGNEPRRVDLEDDHGAINRQVDQQLKFKTRNLLCVPLRGKGKELLGVFEVLNKRVGNFSADDETALTEFATYAAVAIENSQQFGQLLRVRNQLAEQAASGVRMIGDCPAIVSLRNTVSRIAATELAVLILGENGTGKEIVSQLVHYGSHRRNEPFVAVNCAALTETLLESELFGHEKGAFTDARETRQGKFELASGGTLFLDEIGDMSLGGQAKLLRVLEEKVVVRVGGSLPIRTDSRVIAATNQNLAELVRAKKFREDLFFRLNVMTLQVPPLRERGDDILLLAEHFLQEFSARARRKAPELTAAARKRLLSHEWPGNVRELRNLMERLVYLCADDKIDAEELAFVLLPGVKRDDSYLLDLPLADATQQFQVDFIAKQIEAARGNMTAAAERMGLHRTNLYRKMKQLGIPTGDNEQL